MRIFNADPRAFFRRGSAQVEAAMIVPLLILIIAMIIRVGIGQTDSVQVNADRHREQAAGICAGKACSPENLLRGKWMLK